MFDFSILDKGKEILCQVKYDRLNGVVFTFEKNNLEIINFQIIGDEPSQTSLAVAISCAKFIMHRMYGK